MVQIPKNRAGINTNYYHMKRLLIPIICLSFALNTSYSQEYQEVLKDIFYEAEFMLANEFYIDALQEYKKLYDRGYENSSNINYRIGICYLAVPGQKEGAVPYLQQAILNLTPRYNEGIFTEYEAPFDAYLYLGNAYRINNQLESAILAYEKYIELLNQDDSEMADYANHQIEACANARNAMENPIYYIRTNMGETINTSSNDYNPVISSNEMVMVYMTSLAFYDAIKYSKKEDGEWTEPINITPEVQSDGDQYANFLTPDGTELYLNKADNFDSDIYHSEYSEGVWTKSKPLNKYINTKYYESHACVSADNSTLYFVSNRKGGEGGMDIYVSQKDAIGGWGEPLNIGEAINSELSEDHPFISEDGKTLFFSSQGHFSLGGYDIFYSERQSDGSWSTPVNLGYPVNTTDDDLFYVPVGQGDIGYQSLFAEDSYGSRDIYQYRLFPGEAEYLAYLKSLEPEDDVTPEPEPDTEPETDTEPEPDTEPDPEPSRVFTIQTIFFDFDKYSLTGESKQRLDILAEVLNIFPDVKVKAAGNTDALGTDTYNDNLSKNRANSAMKYLISKGIAGDRISIEAMGEKNPVAINTNTDGTDSPEGRTYNRRVEFEISNLPATQVRIESVAVPEHLKLK